MFCYVKFLLYDILMLHTVILFSWTNNQQGFFALYKYIFW